MATLVQFLNKDKERKGWEDEIILSPRFVDDKGKPIKFKIRSMSMKEYDEYQQQAAKMDVKRKTAEYSVSDYRTAVIVNHTVDPSFKDAEALKASGFVKPEQYLNAALKAGEADRLFKAILELSGFGETMDDMVVEAKNS